MDEEHGSDRSVRAGTTRSHAGALVDALRPLDPVIIHTAGGHEAVFKGDFPLDAALARIFASGNP